MENAPQRRIVAIVPDIFFAAKIGETAKHVGAAVEFAGSETELLSKAANPAVLIVLDLNAAGMDMVSIVTKLRAIPSLAQTPLVGFVQHEMSALIDAARKAGCNQVLSRNAFSKNLPNILRG
jgi:CheY-like chemotaxis protein